MTNAALRGKPDAGNPHVRFDEGEVTSAATPRRGSLLYKAIFAALAVAASAVLPLAALDSGDTLKIMTYNIQYAYAWDSTSTPHPTNIANRINAEAPDVCCLQECKSIKNANTPDVIAELTGMHLFFFNDEAILSKSEPIATETVELLPIASYVRYLLIAEFDDYVIANTHMSRSSEQGLPQVDVITNALAKYEGKGKPILFMGDLNTRPGFAVYNKLAPLMTCISPVTMADGEGTYCSEKNDDGEYTWNWILDFIYMDNTAAASADWTWESHVVKDHTTSDHAPVVATITCRRIKQRTIVDEWVNEEAHTQGLTGSWDKSVEYDINTFKAYLNGDYTFTPTSPSGGSPVTMTLTTVMNAPSKGNEPEAGEGAQAAIRLGTNGYFQVWTSSGWLDTTTAGTSGAEYTLQTVFDYVKGKYSVFIYDADSGAWTQMQTAGGTGAFSLANTAVSFLSSVVFAGETLFTSLTGMYVEITGFAENEAVILKGNAQAILTAAQAAWLNKLGDKETVSGKVATLSAKDFGEKFLVNLDITNDEAAYEFKISDMEVTSSGITLTVSLDRTGAVDETINGVLKFCTSTTPTSGYTPGDAVELENGTATKTLPLANGDAVRFYKAVIE